MQKGAGSLVRAIFRMNLRQLKNQRAIDLSTLRSWTFITNHAQVLLAVARDPEATVAELAQAAEITERSAYRMIADLQRAGYVRRRRRRGRGALAPKPPPRLIRAPAARLRLRS